MRPPFFERRLARWVNITRAGRGLPKLRRDDVATSVARKWSRGLALRDEFLHSDQQRLLAHQGWGYAGEVLAKVPRTMKPREVVALWMDSPTHKHVLMSSHPTKHGYGVTWDPESSRYIICGTFCRT